MKPSCRYTINVLATGFVVLVLLSIPLFWTRFLFEALLVEGLPQRSKECFISPSGLVPDKFENDPNVEKHSEFEGTLRQNSPMHLGSFNYLASRIPGGDGSEIIYFYSGRNWAYFDRSKGLIHNCSTHETRLKDGSTRHVRTELYIGPDGIGPKPDKTLGRFKDPIVSSEGLTYGRTAVIYDGAQRCFYMADPRERKITKGPQLTKDDTRQPLRIGYMLNPIAEFSGWVRWLAPQVRVPDKYDPNLPGKLEAITRQVGRSYNVMSPTRHLLVLDASGRIDLLDIETLTFVSAAGYLPTPKSLYPAEGRVRPKDLLDFTATQLVMATDAWWQVQRDWEKRRALGPEDRYNQYLGMAVAATSREGTSQTLAVFDPNGTLITTTETLFPGWVREGSRSRGGYTPTAKAIYFETPWAPVYTITKYVTENLHPPILSAASFLTASTFEAGSGHRSLLFMPNSFVAMQGRHTTQDFFSRIVIGFLFMAPGVILALVLAFIVGKDARKLGFSERARQLWIIATIALGLTAYVTYRLTRPKIALVTCQACGQPRRPDHKTCHRCNSPWKRPDLDAPQWRVMAS